MSEPVPTDFSLTRKINPPKAEVLGVPLAMTSYAEAIDWIDESIALGDKGYICVAATHTVMVCNEDPELLEAVLNSSMTVTDGQPLVWALKMLGHKLPTRVYGPGLMERYCSHAAKTGVPMYLYGGQNKLALDKLAQRLVRRNPGLNIVGGWSPPFRPLTDLETEQVCSEINASGAKIVWVGIGVPKQEKWMAAMRDKLDAPVLIGVGAAFDFHAGMVAQAPPRLQALGLEWAFRLSQEPRRLWRRYTRYNPLFVSRFAAQLVRQRLGSR